MDAVCSSSTWYTEELILYVFPIFFKSHFKKEVCGWYIWDLLVSVNLNVTTNQC
jgi:hypothetical protein